MDPMTALVFAFQVIALFSIAGALLIYLICKVRDDIGNNEPEATSQVRSVFITSADTALGLQLCTFLANKGCRVFAGMKEVQNSLPAKLLSGWMKMHEFNDQPIRGSIIPIQFDVTREDVMREANIAMHMSTGERGIAAVINTSGSLFRGRFDTQDVQQWEKMLKTNILGSLRVAKTFARFLRPTRGRLIYLGAATSCAGEGLLAFNTTAIAVEKLAEELRKELQPHGVSVVGLDTSGLSAESLYNAPAPQPIPNSDSTALQYTANVLTLQSLQVIERALFDIPALERYQLVVPNSKFNFMLPCRSSLRLLKNFNDGAAATIRVQNV